MGLIQTENCRLCVAFIFLDDDLLVKVKQFSTDKKNNSLEFNEFLKMMAVEGQSRPDRARRELLEAFR